MFITLYDAPEKRRRYADGGVEHKLNRTRRIGWTDQDGVLNTGSLEALKGTGFSFSIEPAKPDEQQ